MDDSEETADFPDIVHHIERTDACGGQFQGEANAGRIAESLVEGVTKLRRRSVIGVSDHGKGVGDAMSNVPTRHIRDAVAGERLLLTILCTAPTPHRFLISLFFCL